PSDHARPIGLFDSGVGGLTVARHILEELPAERLICIADCLHAPYGTKKKAAVEERCVTLCDYLISKRVKAIVVACNTATAAAISCLRSLYVIPIIGMEPAVKPAVLLTHTGIVGVLATAGTLNSDKFNRLQEEHGRSVQIITQCCPGLVELVEEGNLNGIETRRLATRYLDPLLARGADTIVLGCTHYPFLLPLLREIAGPKVQILDTGIPVSREVRRQLEIRNLQAPLGNQGGLEIFTSGNTESVRNIGSGLLGYSLQVSPLEV
ncbi:MAG: glutamate racemase, partial [Methylococcales bacterium]